MEYLLRPNPMLMLTVLAVMVCEVARYAWFLDLKLGIQGRGGQQYSYYVNYSLTLPLLVPMLAIFLAIVSTLLWRRLLLLPSPWNLYIVALFLLGLFCVMALLLFRSMSRVMDLREMLRPMLLIAAAETFCFLFEPLRFIFCGTFFFLVTVALGQKAPFTSWDDLADWATGSRGDVHGAPSTPDRARVRVFLEAEGSLSRRGDRIEVQGEQLAEGDGDAVASLARRLLDHARLTEIVAAQERIHLRKDLLGELPQIIAQNLGKLDARREALSQSDLSADEKKERLEKAVGEVLEQAVGGRMRSLLYWHYDLPQEEISFFISRAPQADLKPILSFEQYLGIPLAWYERRKRAAAKP